MSYARSTDGLAFSPGELEDELTMVLGLGLENGQGRADIAEPPVDKSRPCMAGRHGDGLEQRIEILEGNGGEARTEGRGGGHDEEGEGAVRWRPWRKGT